MAVQKIILTLGVLIRNVLCVKNGLARTPQMGWDNWNSLGCNVSDDLLVNTSKRLVSSGLRDVGYNYVILDDCWSDGRDEGGFLKADTKKFPKGMDYVANAIHDEELLFGMYSSAGEMTCAGYAGSLDFETQDAQIFASWGVDYLKYDNCYHLGRWGTPQISFNRFKVMWDALQATGRNILLSLCNWGEDYVHTWGMSIANSWRVSGDIYDSFSRPDDLCACTDDPKNPLCVAPGSHCSVVSIINKVAAFVDRGQPGGWNDLDLLEVGNGGMTDNEYKAHFSMWAALKSPLLMGNDLRTLSPSSLTILNNPAMIAVNQDSVGRSVARIRRDLNVAKDKYGISEIHVWSGPLYGGDQLVVFLNVCGEDREVSASLAEIFFHDGPEGSAPQVKDTWEIYDLWGNRMDATVAKKILDASADDAGKILREIGWYNSTALPYEEGLKKRDPRLLGKKIGGVVSNGGTMSTRVKMHSVEIFRLSRVENVHKSKVHFKQEL